MHEVEQQLPSTPEQTLPLALVAGITGSVPLRHEARDTTERLASRSLQSVTGASCAGCAYCQAPPDVLSEPRGRLPAVPAGAGEPV